MYIYTYLYNNPSEYIYMVVSVFAAVACNLRKQLVGDMWCTMGDYIYRYIKSYAGICKSNENAGTVSVFLSFDREYNEKGIRELPWK